MLFRQRCRIALLITTLPTFILPPGTSLAGIFGEKKGPADGPITLQQAAAYVDDIDRRLFGEGTIGVKSPGVWGQNRLTKYRAEFESQMSGRLNQFQDILSAAQARTDIATLTSATSLGATVAAAQSKGTAATPAKAVAPTMPPLNLTILSPSSSSTSATPAASSGSSGSSDPGNPDFTGLANQLKAVSDRLDTLKMGAVSLPNGINTFVNKSGSVGVGLEPTVHLDEEANYINHLHQLRLINDGDDLTDMAGYGLYLMRMPISVLPGPESRKGKGAVVTIEARHDLTDDLLPNTFRDVAIMDLTFSLTQIVNEQIHQNIFDHCHPVDPANTSESNINNDKAKAFYLKRSSLKHVTGPKNVAGPNAFLIDNLRLILGPLLDGDRVSDVPAPASLNSPLPMESAASTRGRTSLQPTPARPAAPPAVAAASRAKPGVPVAVARRDQVAQARFNLADSVIPAQLTNDPDDTNRLALLVDSMTQAQTDPFRHDPATMTLFQSALIDVYRFMRENEPNLDLFQVSRIEQLAVMLQRRDYPRLRNAREQFLRELACYHSGLPAPPANWSRDVEPSDVLAFALLLQFITVDRQLKQDMRFMAERRGLGCGDVQGLCFYEFYPSPEARNAFKDYVACKWPLHVYSIDPVVDQQNVLDAYSRRTELQLALAVAVSTGQFNIKNASSFARQLDLDLQTVGLNRTAVGFGAGDTTFGWMFYPRVQTPQPVSNFRAFTNTLTGTGQGINSDLRSRRIEPGQRECIALMVTPNFIPSMRISTVANWFDLTGLHAKQRLSNQEMLESSRKLQQAKAAIARACDSHEYRPSDFTVLTQRIKQLETLLPTQDTRVDLPDEADLMGSELFSSNASGLSPSLLAWYGETVAEGQRGSIFLQGRGFSVTETQVIVGGIPLQQGPEFRLISRNLMQIIIPENARAVAVDLTQLQPKAATKPAQNNGTGQQATGQLNALGQATTNAPTKPGASAKPDPTAFASVQMPGGASVEVRGGVAEVLVGDNQRAAATLDPTLNSDVNVTINDGRGSATARGAKVDLQVGRIKAHAEGTAAPADKPKTPCDRAVIEVHIATPNGVSNHLMVEVIPKAPAHKDDPPKNAVTTATTTTTVRGDTTTTSTRFETTPPGAVLPPLTVLPMGTTWPPASVLAPGAVTGAPAGSLLPGLVPAAPAASSPPPATKFMLLTPTTPPTSDTPAATTPPAGTTTTTPPAGAAATTPATTPALAAAPAPAAPSTALEDDLAHSPANFRLPPLPVEAEPTRKPVPADATARRVRPSILRRIGLPDPR
jgi:hypothetical protein